VRSGAGHEGLSLTAPHMKLHHRCILYPAGDGECAPGPRTVFGATPQPREPRTPIESLHSHSPPPKRPRPCPTEISTVSPADFLAEFALTLTATPSGRAHTHEISPPYPKPGPTRVCRRFHGGMRCCHPYPDGESVRLETQRDEVAPKSAGGRQQRESCPRGRYSAFRGRSEGSRYSLINPLI
jgi:hypothetical protein